MKYLEKAWGLAIGIILVLGALYYFADSRSPAGANFTVYPVQCSSPATSIGDCSNPQRLDRIAYKIDPSRNEIIYWDPDVPAGKMIYANAGNCSIVDINNWSCKSADGASFGANNNKYFDNRTQNTIFLSAVDWSSMQMQSYPANNILNTTSGTNDLSQSDVTNEVTIHCHLGSGQDIRGRDSGLKFYSSDFDSSGAFINNDMNTALQGVCGISSEEAMTELQKLMQGDKSAILFTVSLDAQN